MSKASRRRKHAKPAKLPSVPATTLLAIDGGRKPMKAMRKPQGDTRVPFAQMYQAAPQPPWVPEGAQIAMDYAMQPAYDYAGEFTYYGTGVTWLGFPFLAELAQRPEYRVISEIRAKEMTRKGFELTYSGEDEKGAEAKLADLEQACEDFGVITHLRIGAEHDGFFGGGHLYIDVCDPDNTAELVTPLMIAAGKIPKGGLKGFKNVEPMWCYPANYNSSDPLKPHFFKPQEWYVNGKTVHVSRLMTLISREMPDILKASYSFRGLSLSQMAMPYVDNWLRTRQSVSDLIHSFSIIVLATNMESAIQEGGDWAGIDTRLDWMNAFRDNRGSLAIDKETEELTNIAAPLGTLDALQAQAQEQMASIVQTPLVKLLGTSPAGLNSSTDGEIRVFYDTIHALQEHLFDAPLKTMLECIQLHLWGKIDPDISFRYIPLWQLDEAAQAEVRKTEADTHAVMIQEGVISPEDVRGMLIADKDSPYAGLDPDDLPEPPDDPAEMSVGGGEAKGETASEQRAAV